MPVFVAKVFKGGPHTLGWLMAAQGGGAVTGALWLASRKGVAGLGRVLCLAGAAFGLGLIAFALSRVLWLSLPILLVTGGGMMVQMAVSNTLLQTIVDDDKRGRVMSFYTMAFFGMVPFGSLVAGFGAEHIGAPWTVACGGGLTLLGVAWFARILPELRAEMRKRREASAAVPPSLPEVSDANV
jgi:MFS family permease